jgi:hypothetical protein
MDEPRNDRRAAAAAPRDPRSAMARASDVLPFKPYVYRGEPEPPAVTRARQRAREQAPGTGRDEAFIVGGDGWDPLGTRELAEPREPCGAPPPAAIRCKHCGYLITAAGHQVTCHG